MEEMITNSMMEEEKWTTTACGGGTSSVGPYFRVSDGVTLTHYTVENTAILFKHEIVYVYTY